MELSAREHAVLDFEREWWKLPGRKNVEIRARFAMSSSSYYRALHALLERPEAGAYDPLTVLGCENAASRCVAPGSRAVVPTPAAGERLVSPDRAE